MFECESASYDTSTPYVFFLCDEASKRIRILDGTSPVLWKHCNVLVLRPCCSSVYVPKTSNDAVLPYHFKPLVTFQGLHFFGSNSGSSSTRLLSFGCDFDLLPVPDVIAESVKSG